VWEGWKRAVAWVEAAEGEGRGPVDVAGGWSGSGWAPTVEGWNMCPVQRRVVVSVS
jgi:hypothetical protein